MLGSTRRSVAVRVRDDETEHSTVRVYHVLGTPLIVWAQCSGVRDRYVGRLVEGVLVKTRHSVAVRDRGTPHRVVTA